MCTQENVDTFKELFNRTNHKYISDLFRYMRKTSYFNENDYRFFKNSINNENISVDIDIDINPKDRSPDRFGNTPIIHQGHIFKGCGNLIVNFHIKGENKYFVARELSNHFQNVEGHSLLMWLHEIFFKYLGIDVFLDFADIKINFVDNIGKIYDGYDLGYEGITPITTKNGSWVKVDDDISPPFL